MNSGYHEKKNSDENVSIYEIVMKNKELKKEIDDYILNPTFNSLKNILDNIDIGLLNPGVGDLFAKRLYGICDNTKIFILVAFFVVFALIPPMIAIIENNFLNPVLNIDTLHDYGYWNQYILGLSAILLMSCMYFGRLTFTLFELTLTRVFELTKKDWKEFKDWAENKIFKNKLIIFIPYMIAVPLSISLTKTYVFSTDNLWISVFGKTPTIAGWLIPVLIFTLYFLLIISVIRVIAVYLVLRRFFKLFRANVQPLHPDKCGGLAPLGRLSMRLNIGVFLFGIVSVVGVLVNVYHYNKPYFYIYNIYIILGYLISATILFFLPLTSAHKSMKNSKIHSLCILNSKFDEINEKLLNDKDIKTFPNEVAFKQLERIHKFHNMVSQMPVYPFNMKTVSSFIGSVVTPIMVLIVVEIIKKWII